MGIGERNFGAQHLSSSPAAALAFSMCEGWIHNLRMTAFFAKGKLPTVQIARANLYPGLSDKPSVHVDRCEPLQLGAVCAEVTLFDEFHHRVPHAF
jgi:hypothetical protein